MTSRFTLHFRAEYNNGKNREDEEKQVIPTLLKKVICIKYPLASRLKCEMNCSANRHHLRRKADLTLPPSQKIWLGVSLFLHSIKSSSHIFTTGVSDSFVKWLQYPKCKITKQYSPSRLSFLKILQHLPKEKDRVPRLILSI